jgi:DNA-binding CsgD family transcriptional regulator
MTTVNTLEQGRKAFKTQVWGDAYALLSSADDEISLAPDDLKRLATAAYLVGEESDCNEIWARAHQEYLDSDEIKQAAYCAFWLGMILFDQGDTAQGSGWMARAGRLVKEIGEDCAEKGLLMVPQALQHLRQNDPEGAYKIFSDAGAIGAQCDNPDLLTLSRLGRGQALIKQKKITEGTTLLDEAMVAVVADEVSPIVAGIVYCAVIETCQKIYDLRRAQEWTQALSNWCDSHPDLVPYRGQCLIRRAEVMQLHGEWGDAMSEAHRASEMLNKGAGEALYLKAELFRLQGDFENAEATYRLASKKGFEPQPGLALLRMAQGQMDAAEVAIRRLEEEKEDVVARLNILPAFIEIMLALDDNEAAQDGARELTQIADEFKAPFLQAISTRADGNILLAGGEPKAALSKLLNAWSELKRIGASYESAKTRILIGLSYRKLGDDDTADMELDAARWKFQELGAAYDFNKVDSLMQNNALENTHGLTPRELQVLRHLATGKTNKEIGSELFISERTVDRHVSNILGKLGVPSRAAATAFAYEHNLT